MKNRNLPKREDWQTPNYLYDKLDSEFNFDFDPCPAWYEILNDWFGFDGLNIEWGKRNFINPPYARGIKDKFIRKAYEESKKNKLCVMLLPVSTSSKTFHEVIYPHAEIRFLRGRVPFKGITVFGKTVTKGLGMFDSMIVIFRPT